MSEQVIDDFELQPEHWRPPTETEAAGSRCRWTVGPGHRSCKARPVAMLARGRHGTRGPVWWAYCEAHLYGRRLDDRGRLLSRRLIAEKHMVSL